MLMLTGASRLQEWKSLSSSPHAVHETASRNVDGEMWVFGGFSDKGDLPGDGAAVSIYNPKEDRWRVGPAMPYAVHHSFSGWEIQNPRRLVFLGGVIPSADGNHLKGEGNNGWLVLNLEPASDLSGPNPSPLIRRLRSKRAKKDGSSNRSSAALAWEVIPSRSDQPVGGLCHCTLVPIEGLYYCLVFTQDYVSHPDTAHFYQVDADRLSLKELPVFQDEWSTHVAMLADPVRGEVVLVGGRTGASHKAISHNQVRIFNIQALTWTRAPDVPTFPADSRASYQDPENPQRGLLFSGQCIQHYTTIRSILSFDLSSRPISFSVVGALPVSLYGPAIMRTGDSFIVACGSSAIGPNSRVHTYLWTPPLPLPELHRQGHPQRLPGTWEVLSAFFGRYDVTREISALVAAGPPSERNLLIDSRRPAMLKIAPGLAAMPSTPGETLIITFLYDGQVKLVICPPYELPWGIPCIVSFH